MRHRPSPHFVLALCIALIVQSVGCASSGSTGDTPAQSTEYLPVRDALETLETGTKVIVLLQNYSIVRGWYERMENLPPRRVYAVPLPALPQVVDSLREWTPVQGESFVIYQYPSLKLFDKSNTNLAVWGGDLRSLHPNVCLMTPQTTGDTKFTVRIRIVPRYGTFTHVAALPADSISGIFTDTKQPDGVLEQVGISVGLVAAGAIFVLGVPFLAWTASWVKL